MEKRYKKLFKEQDTLKEKLAEYAHMAWSNWMVYLMQDCETNSDGSINIPKERVDRFQRQMSTAYNDLSEEEKESDREEADKIIKIISGK